MIGKQKEKAEKNSAALREAANRGILVAAHRGTHGGNIVQNTIAAYENALLHRADILEADIGRTLDGELYMLHDGNEMRVLGVPYNIRTMTSREVDAQNPRNEFGRPTGAKLCRLEETLQRFKGRGCFINADRCWDFWDEVFALVGKYDMFDQVFFKSPAQAKYLEKLAGLDEPVMYMPIVYTPEEVEIVSSYDLNLIGLELIFESEHHPFAQEKTVRDYRKQGLLLWVNAITLYDRHYLCAGHDDDFSICKGMDGGWGWLAKRGYNIIQTDWPLLLKDYLDSQKTHTLL